MALMTGTVDEALREADASEEKARRDRDINTLRTDVSVLRWMTGTMIGLQLATIGILLSYALIHVPR